MRHGDLVFLAGLFRVYGGVAKVCLARKAPQGQQLGLVGNTGRSQAPHLHYQYAPNGQIFEKKTLVDPDACVDVLADGSIAAGDNGSLADDAFEILLNGLSIGQTTIGGQNTLAASGLKPGTLTLTLVVAIAPDDIGTWFIELNDGLTFADGTTFRSSSNAQGTRVHFTINVPSS